MSRLIVQDFGAIKKATIDIRKYNFFIGHTSSGKSTIAKLLAIFNNAAFWSIREGDLNAFVKLLDKYNINFELLPSTVIRYESEQYYWDIGKDKFHSNYKDADLMELAGSSDDYTFISKVIERKEKDAELKNFIEKIRTLFSGMEEKDDFMSNILKSILMGVLYEECIPVYIPAERLLISTFSNSIFSLLQAGASIPDCIKDFGSLYEKARNQYKKIDIDILNIQVSFDNQKDTVYLSGENKELGLTQASSGIQSIIPLWTVFNLYVERQEKQMLVIEEPELNLFPSTQHLLIDWIMGKMKESKGSIVITTHSPYVLSVIDNLILAQNILDEQESEKALQRVEELIPSMGLIKFDEISSYFFHSNGEVTDIRDTELKTTGAEYIDGASNELGYIFDELCKIGKDGM